MTTQILLIVVAVAALLGGILAWDILVPPSLPTLRVELDGMAPEIGKPLSVRAVEEATGIEAAREELAAIRDPQFEIRLPNLHPERRYVVDIYVDHNGNRQYDPPPEDHAWRKVVEIGEGDERATFTLGTDFTDVRWPEAASAPMIVDGRIAPGEYAHTTVSYTHLRAHET